MDLNAYKRRLGSTSASEALVNATKSQVRSMFTDSPLYRKILLNGIEKGVRLSFEKDGEYQILLMPDEQVKIGDSVTINGNPWLVQETVQDEIYPKGKIKYCNNFVKWVNNGVPLEYPAIVSGKTYDLEQEKNVFLAEGQAIAIIPYNTDTKTIKISTRFIFGNSTYEVIGIDDLTKVANGTGLITLTLELVSKSENDNDVADNSNTWGGAW